MKHAFLLGAASLVICSAAFASGNPGNTTTTTQGGSQPGGTTAFLPPDCATGFTKAGVTGSPTGTSYSYECHTPKITCPKAAAGLIQITVPPKMDVTGNTVKFTYYCQYGVPPK